MRWSWRRKSGRRRRRSSVGVAPAALPTPSHTPVATPTLSHPVAASGDVLQPSEDLRTAYGRYLRQRRRTSDGRGQRRSQTEAETIMAVNVDAVVISRRAMWAIPAPSRLGYCFALTGGRARQMKLRPSITYTQTVKTHRRYNRRSGSCHTTV